MRTPKSSSKFLRLAALACCLASGPALAGAAPDTENGRYALSPSGDGVLRLDTRTGAISTCNNSGAGWACYAVPDERAAMVQLAASLEVLKPQPSQALAMLLSETVERLVRQIMGTVEVDRETLIERCERAAELIGDEAGPMRLRLHPDDLELLADAPIDTPLVGDHGLLRGTIRLETDEGWIEDGPEARLERLRAALDQMGLAAREVDAS